MVLDTFLCLSPFFFLEVKEALCPAFEACKWYGVSAPYFLRYLSTLDGDVVTTLSRSPFPFQIYQTN